MYIIDRQIISYVLSVIRTNDKNNENIVKIAIDKMINECSYLDKYKVREALHRLPEHSRYTKKHMYVIFGTIIENIITSILLEEGINLLVTNGSDHHTVNFENTKDYEKFDFCFLNRKNQISGVDAKNATVAKIISSYKQLWLISSGFTFGKINELMTTYQKKMEKEFKYKAKNPYIILFASEFLYDIGEEECIEAYHKVFNKYAYGIQDVIFVIQLDKFMVRQEYDGFSNEVYMAANKNLKNIVYKDFYEETHNAVYSKRGHNVAINISSDACMTLRDFINKINVCSI